VPAHEVELTRGYVKVFNARQLDAFIAYCDPRIEFHSVFEEVGGAVYHGHDGMRQWHRDFEEVWGKEIRLEPEAYFDLGEQTLAFLVIQGRGQQSGADVAMPYAHVVRWRNDLAVYATSYIRREDALRALGVTQDELEPLAP
jgi:hypothetical protein